MTFKPELIIDELVEDYGNLEDLMGEGEIFNRQTNKKDFFSWFYVVA